MREKDPYPSGKRGQQDDEDREIKPLFELGQVVGTPGAIQALIDAEQDPGKLLRRHMTGDWGELDDEDKEENELSVREGFRILSAYRLNSGVKVWLITESDRSVTTILLPREY
jgi:hypothetical protein